MSLGVVLELATLHNIPSKGRHSVCLWDFNNRPAEY